MKMSLEDGQSLLEDFKKKLEDIEPEFQRMKLQRERIKKNIKVLEGFIYLEKQGQLDFGGQQCSKNP